MLQNLTFDARIQQLKDSDPTTPKAIQANSFHDDTVITKKLCIVWDTGRRMFFHYIHFMTCDFDPNPDLNSLTLEFMTRYIILKGFHLEGLYGQFMQDEPHIISVVSERYAGLRAPGQPFVIDAVVEK